MEKSDGLDGTGANWIVCYWMWVVSLFYGRVMSTRQGLPVFLVMVAFAISATVTALWPRSRVVALVVRTVYCLILAGGGISLLGAGRVWIGIGMLAFAALAFHRQRSLFQPSPEGERS